MEEEEEETTLEPTPNTNLRKTSSTVTLIQQDVSRTTSTSTLVAESFMASDQQLNAEQTTTIATEQVTKASFKQATALALTSDQAAIASSDYGAGCLPLCQIVTQQASADSVESESESVSLKISPRYSRLTTPHSSSSQEEYDLPAKGQFLTTGHRTDTARSMESLKTTSRSFLSASERDMRKVFSTSTEAKSLESIDREMVLKRHAVSGEGAALSLSSSSEISAEKKRGLW